jgi:tetratricopeptide (TPR) repeat protein
MSWITEIGGGLGKQALLRARQYLEDALKNPNALAYQALSSLSLSRHQHEKAVAEAKRALALEPNEPANLIVLAEALIFNDNAKEALQYLDNAMNLDPLNLGRPLCTKGLANFSMDQMEEAVKYFERGLKYNPNILRYDGPVAATYAYLNKNNEAKTALKRFVDQFVYTPNLQVAMSSFPFRNPRVADLLAEGLLKAGLEGKLTDYCKVSQDNKLPGEEIRKIFGGRKAIGFDPYFGKDWWIKYGKDGKASFQDPWGSDKGKFWVEEDMIFYKWRHRRQGVTECFDVYKNPIGSPERRNEYLFVSDWSVEPFSVMK